MRLPERLDALRERNYRRLFVGQLFSFMGDQMTPVAMTFAILDRGGSAGQVGWVLASGTTTMVAFVLLGGAISDRFSRRKVMLAADLSRCVAQSGVAGLLIWGHWHIWELVALEAVWGTGAAFFTPAMTGVMPELLTGEQLVQGNALLGLTRSVGSVVGPSLAGALVAGAGPGWAVALDAATFAISAFNLARIDLAPMRGRAVATSVITDLRQGWAEFRARSWLWSIVAEFSIWHLLVFGPMIVLGAVVAKKDLGGATAWGIILSGMGIGSIVGGIVALHVRPPRPLLVATVATLGFVPIPALLGARAPVALLAGAAGLGGAGFAVFSVLWDTTMQQQIPSHLLSRVSSYDWFGSIALLPLGYAIAGPLASTFGLFGTLYGSSVVMCALILAVLFVPSVRRLRSSYVVCEPAPSGPPSPLPAAGP